MGEGSSQYYHSGTKLKHIISTKLFRSSSFVSWQAQLMTRNEITSTILNTPSDFRAYELGTPRS